MPLVGTHSTLQKAVSKTTASRTKGVSQVVTQFHTVMVPNILVTAECRNTSIMDSCIPGRKPTFLIVFWCVFLQTVFNRRRLEVSRPCHGVSYHLFCGCVPYMFRFFSSQSCGVKRGLLCQYMKHNQKNNSQLCL